ncbi:MAG: hypothetical protein QW434_10460 [Pyrobaculum sp.]
MVVETIAGLILLIGTWYSLAHLVARRHNRRVAERCNCEVLKTVGGPDSLYLDLECDGVRLGLFQHRLPWDNPINLMAALLSGRRPYTVVRFKTPVEVGVFDASRRGAGRRVGSFYVVNTSAPRALVEMVLQAAERSGVWRVTASGGVLQLLIPHTDCKRAVETALNFYKLLS